MDANDNTYPWSVNDKYNTSTIEPKSHEAIRGEIGPGHIRRFLQIVDELAAEVRKALIRANAGQANDNVRNS